MPERAQVLLLEKYTAMKLPGAEFINEETGELISPEEFDQKMGGRPGSKDGMNSTGFSFSSSVAVGMNAKKRKMSGGSDVVSKNKDYCSFGLPMYGTQDEWTKQENEKKALEDSFGVNPNNTTNEDANASLDQPNRQAQKALRNIEHMVKDIQNGKQIGSKIEKAHKKNGRHRVEKDKVEDQMNKWVGVSSGRHPMLDNPENANFQHPKFTDIQKLNYDQYFATTGALVPIAEYRPELDNNGNNLINPAIPNDFAHLKTFDTPGYGKPEKLKDVQKFPDACFVNGIENSTARNNKLYSSADILFCKKRKDLAQIANNPVTNTNSLIPNTNNTSSILAAASPMKGTHGAPRRSTNLQAVGGQIMTMGAIAKEFQNSSEIIANELGRSSSLTTRRNQLNPGDLGGNGNQSMRKNTSHSMNSTLRSSLRSSGPGDNGVNDPMSVSKTCRFDLSPQPARKISSRNATASSSLDLPHSPSEFGSTSGGPKRRRKSTGFSSTGFSRASGKSFGSSKGFGNMSSKEALANFGNNTKHSFEDWLDGRDGGGMGITADNFRSSAAFSTGSVRSLTGSSSIRKNSKDSADSYVDPADIGKNNPLAHTGKSWLSQFAGTGELKDNLDFEKLYLCVKHLDKENKSQAMIEDDTSASGALLRKIIGKDETTPELEAALIRNRKLRNSEYPYCRVSKTRLQFLLGFVEEFYFCFPMQEDAADFVCKFLMGKPYLPLREQRKKLFPWLMEICIHNVENFVENFQLVGNSVRAIVLLLDLDAEYGENRFSKSNIVGSNSESEAKGSKAKSDMEAKTGVKMAVVAYAGEDDQHVINLKKNQLLQIRLMHVAAKALKSHLHGDGDHPRLYGEKAGKKWYCKEPSLYYDLSTANLPKKQPPNNAINALKDRVEKSKKQEEQQNLAEFTDTKYCTGSKSSSAWMSSVSKKVKVEGTGESAGKVINSSGKEEIIPEKPVKGEKKKLTGEEDALQTVSILDNLKETDALNKADQRRENRRLAKKMKNAKANFKEKYQELKMTHAYHCFAYTGNRV